ncbi:MAG TPA: porin [Paraburkholderia sp.]|uniref:porin n=1 Tax=Paraburkholderia sp. TaxID=1926495 RepID=UPI002B4A2311|nr:porin [Paraburkholderia sp.]HKR46714.1 porin [Paraburkholderia sp.]
MFVESCGKFVAVFAICSWAMNASAQSATLYGIVDSGIYYQSKSAGNKGAIFGALDGGDYPSIYGLMGSEDLGGGLTAGFKLEGGFSSTSGAFGNSNGGIFGRNAYVSLGNEFGTVRAGLQFSPFFTTVVINGDPRGAPNNGSMLPIYLDNFLIAGMFDSNSIVYLSPKIAGFSGSFEYAPGGAPGSLLNGQRISASVSYESGALGGDLAYYQSRDVSSGKVTLLGRSADLRYTLGSVRFAVGGTNFRNTSGSIGTNVYVIDGGANWQVTPVLGLNGAVYYSFDKTTKQNQSTMVAIGSTYSLSKRTSLYAQAAYVQNRGTMGTGINANANGQFGGLPEGGTSSVNIGIRHLF